MKINPEGIFRKRIFTGAALVSALLWALSLAEAFLVPDFLTGVPTAWASNRYGILGQAAPDLNLAHWIDGDGKKTQQVRLSDYRGKVIYLYFFQDW